MRDKEREIRGREKEWCKTIHIILLLILSEERGRKTVKDSE